MSEGVLQAQMQWLRPLLELLHHYRLNRPNPLLAPLFASLLLRPSPALDPGAAQGRLCSQPTNSNDEATLLVDVLITNYKALFSPLPIISVVEIPKSPRSSPAGPAPLACTVLTGPPSGLERSSAGASAAASPLQPDACWPAAMPASGLPPPQAGAAWAVRSPRHPCTGGTEAARMQTALAGRGIDLIEDLEGNDAELQASVAGLLQAGSFLVHAMAGVRAAAFQLIRVPSVGAWPQLHRCLSGEMPAQQAIGLEALCGRSVPITSFA